MNMKNVRAHMYMYVIAHSATHTPLHTPVHMHARTHARTHACTHTLLVFLLELFQFDPQLNLPGVPSERVLLILKQKPIHVEDRWKEELVVDLLNTLTGVVKLKPGQLQNHHRRKTGEPALQKRGRGRGRREGGEG